jgi:hypothetical protein
MSMNVVTLLYLIASVCFIQALKGLSHPTTSIRGNIFGMVGMAIAVFTTTALIFRLAQGNGTGLLYVLAALVVGGGLGATMANRVEMTKMPELVAFMHSMIGLAAVFIAIAAAVEPWAFGRSSPRAARSRRQPAGARAGLGDRCHHLQRLGDRLRQAVGQVQVPAVPGGAGAVRRPAQAQPGAGPGAAGQRRALHPQRRLHVLHRRHAAGLRDGRADHHPDRRRRHAGRGVDAQQLFGLGGGRHRLQPEQRDADHRRQPGGLVGRDPELHHVQGHEPLVLQRDPGRLRRRGRRGRRCGRAAQRQERQRRRRRLRAGQCRDGRDRARLRPGRGAGAACRQGAGRQADREGVSPSSTRSTRWPAGCRAT